MAEISNCLPSDCPGAMKKLYPSLTTPFPITFKSRSPGSVLKITNRILVGDFFQCLDLYSAFLQGQIVVFSFLRF